MGYGGADDGADSPTATMVPSDWKGKARKVTTPVGGPRRALSPGLEHSTSLRRDRSGKSGRLSSTPTPDGFGSRSPFDPDGLARGLKRKSRRRSIASTSEESSDDPWSDNEFYGRIGKGALKREQERKAALRREKEREAEEKRRNKGRKFTLAHFHSLYRRTANPFSRHTAFAKLPTTSPTSVFLFLNF